MTIRFDLAVFDLAGFDLAGARNLSFALVGGSILAACGGGGTGESNTTGGGAFAPSSTYATLTDAAGGTSQLAGAAINGSSPTLATQTIQGSYTHADGSIFLTSPSATGGAGLVVTPTSFAFDTYDYARAVDVADATTNYTGVVGLATAAADVNGSTKATYTVEFEGSYSDGTAVAQLTNWNGPLVADFANNNVGMSVTGGGAGDFNEITVTDATISGNGFAGGQFSTSLDGAQVNATGTNANTAGTFFGFDPTLSAPAEVGGVLASQNGTAILTGAFMGALQ